MSRKILAICAALVAFGALAVAPSMASAALTLQDTEGGITTKLRPPENPEPAAKIIADGIGSAKFIGGGTTIECNENVLTASVHKNDGNEIQATIEGAWFGSNLTPEGTKCKSGLGNVTVTIPGLTNAGGTKHWCIRTVPGKDNWQLWGNNCTTEPTTGELTFILDIGFLTCRYKKTGFVEGTFNTTNTHETLKLTLSGEPGFTLEAESSFGCPAEGKLSNFVFDVYTDPDKELVKGDVHSYIEEPTENPVFITPEA